MKQWLPTTMSIFSVIVLGAMATPAPADDCNQLTYFTFSGPVELPGVVLPAGTYQFVHPDCQGGVVLVTSQNGRHVVGTFLTMQEYRTRTSHAPEVVFAEMPAGIPEAIKVWFYPRRNYGDEFVYRKREARRVSAAPERVQFAD